jgi:hypothetical protein
MCLITCHASALRRDAPNEWYFDTTSQKLYYYYNGTTVAAEGNSTVTSTVIPPDVVFEATNVAGLVSINADMSKPAKDISFKGIGFKDTIYTYLDPHEMPSGGDWVSAEYHHGESPPLPPPLPPPPRIKRPESALTPTLLKLLTLFLLVPGYSLAHLHIRIIDTPIHVLASSYTY